MVCCVTKRRLRLSEPVADDPHEVATQAAIIVLRNSDGAILAMRSFEGV